MLWYSPYYVSGYARDPDCVWHSSVALYIQEILNGMQFVVSDYARAYPGSFIFNYAALEITGTGVPTYARLVYPAFWIIAMIVSWYAFICKLFSQHVAFTSTLLAIPGLHFLHLHPSPESAGIILTLSALILLITRRDMKGKITGLLVILALLITHPVSPLILIVFLVATNAAGLLFRDVKAPITILMPFLIGIGWFTWVIYYSVKIGFNILSGVIYPQIAELSLKGIARVAFVYPMISDLTVAIYFSYLAVAIVYFLFTVKVSYKASAKTKTIRQILTRAGYNNVLLLIVAFICLGLSYFILTVIGNRVLIERSLTFFILTISVYIASNVISYVSKASSHMHKAKTWIPRLLIGIWLTSLVLTYPIVAYSMDAFNSLPPSEGAGIKFLASQILSDKEYVSMMLPGQLALYSKPPTGYKFIGFPPNLNWTSPHIVVFCLTNYFYIAMRFDYSFTDNRYTQAYEQILASPRYNKIYSNPSCEVYKTGQKG